jgi:hypothetical protein
MVPGKPACGAHRSASENMMRVIIPAVLSFAAVLGYASSAHALEYEIGLRPGVGAAGSKSPVRYNGGPVNATQITPSDSIFGGGSAPYDVGFVGQLNLGVRFLSIFSAGLMSDVRFLSKSTPSDVTNLSRNSWTFGPYGRVYFPLGISKLEPWLGIGIQYLHDTQNFNVATGSEKITSEAITVPITVGAMYPIVKRYLSVGPSFTVAPVFPTGGCVDGVGYEYCASDPPQSNIVMLKDYATWTVGLDIQATLP